MYSSDFNATAADADMAAIDKILAKLTGDLATNNTLNTAMDVANAPMSPSNSNTAGPIPLATTIVDFSSLSADDQAKVYQICSDIGLAWGIVAPASPFPATCHPDPGLTTRA